LSSLPFTHGYRFPNNLTARKTHQPRSISLKRLVDEDIDHLASVSIAVSDNLSHASSGGFLDQGFIASILPAPLSRISLIDPLLSTAMQKSAMLSGTWQ
jgi:hypothetical protein